ncbi:hypothetical protein AZA_62761 [Nitrospirillum viridazoti Y2]|nr:hypothetical protein AZA_62761 [Nitrospirillum amazonense Y2]
MTQFSCQVNLTFIPDCLSAAFSPESRPGTSGTRTQIQAFRIGSPAKEALRKPP